MEYFAPVELGLEPTPEEYVQNMVEVFRGVWRVLRDNGTVWLNLGDSYWGGKGQSGHANKEYQEERVQKGLSFNVSVSHVGGQGKTRPSDGKHEIIKPKDLVGIPWRVALALQADGWYLRSDIIWNKTNPMPESVNDRPTKAHEYIFLLTKNAKYYYDAEAVRESQEGEIKTRRFSSDGGAKARALGENSAGNEGTGAKWTDTGKRNKRSVWTVSTRPYPEAHFACVDEDTECLTIEGWKRYSEIMPGMVAAQYDMEAGKLQWEKVQDVAIYDVVNEPLVVAQNRDVKLMLTPNHRTIISRRHPKTRKHQPLTIIRADELKKTHSIPVSAKWDYEGIEPVTPEWAELLGWYVTEGCETIYNWTVEIYQSKTVNPEKVKRIEYLLNAVGAEYSKAECVAQWQGSNRVTTAFQVKGYAAIKLREYAPKKLLPHSVLMWSNRLLEKLLDGLVDGDGHRRADGRMSFIQRGKQMADLVQAIGTRLGYATMCSWRSQGSYTVYFTPKKLLSFRGTAGEGAEIKQELYTGKIWCPKLPAGTWVARKKGRMFITGNTFPQKLIEPCILAGTSPQACEECGSPWERVVEKNRKARNELNPSDPRYRPNTYKGAYADINGKGDAGYTETETTGWEPTCKCDNKGAAKSTVLDPFAGSGTTLYVAEQYGRNSIGIELSGEYCQLIHKRMDNFQQTLFNYSNKE